MSVRSALEGLKPDEKLLLDTEELLRSRTGKKKFRLNMVVTAACLPLILGVLFFFFQACRLPAAYISVDVNPSLELGINRFDRVVEVNYYNSDAENLVTEKQLFLLKPSDAIKVIMGALDQKGYMRSGDVTVITIAANSDNEGKSGVLLAKCIKGLEQYNKPLNVVSDTVPGQLKEEADSLSISFGKLKLIKVIQQLDKSAKVNDYKDVSIASIMDYISFLTSDQYSGVDESTKKNLKIYMDSVETIMDGDIKPVTQRNEEAEKAASEAAATKAAAEAEAEKAASEAAVTKAAAEAEAKKAASEAAVTKAAAEAEAKKAASEAAATKAAAEAEAEKAASEAAATKAAAEAEAEKAASEAAATKAAAEAEAEKAASEAAATKAAADNQ